MSPLALAGAGLLAVVVLLLVLPLQIVLRVASSPPRAELRLGWPVAWLPALSLPRTGRAAGRSADAPPPRRARRPAAAPHPRRSARRARALRAVPSAIGSVARVFRVERLSLHGRFGAGDPALTGQIYGACAAAGFAAAACPRIDLRLVPDFTAACLTADGQAVLRVRPGALAIPVLRFLWACYGPGR